MTLQGKGRFARKHGPGRKPIPEATEAVMESARAGEISCATAFGVAKGLRVSPAEVGLAMDCLDVAIVKCQLGLFGHGSQWRIVEPAEEVAVELRTAIRMDLVEGRLPCTNAWRIAADFDLPRMGVAAACERLGIRICACQLGAF